MITYDVQKKTVKDSIVCYLTYLMRLLYSFTEDIQPPPQKMVSKLG